MNYFKIPSLCYVIGEKRNIEPAEKIFAQRKFAQEKCKYI